MYDLKNFSPYDRGDLKPTNNVLVWSKATGYYFTQYSKVTDQQIVAVED